MLEELMALQDIETSLQKAEDQVATVQLQKESVFLGKPLFEIKLTMN